jgi:hypothetical protein
MCRTYPTLRVVGLEPAGAPRREALANIAAAGYSDRIQIRDQPVEALTDVERFDLAYLPQVFLPEDAFIGGLATVRRALRPGGWLNLAGNQCSRQRLPGRVLAVAKHAVGRRRASSRAGGRCGNPVRVHRRTNPPSRRHHAYGAGATTSLTGCLRSDRASASASHIPSTSRTTFSPPSMSVLTTPWLPARDPPIAIPPCGNRLRFRRPPSASRGADGPS